MSATSRADCFGCWVSRWPYGTKPVPEPVFALGEHWTLNHREIGAARRACWVLQTREHLIDLQHATAGQAAEMGPALAAAVQAVTDACEADKVYVLMTNQRGHVHLDLIPRWADDPALTAEQLVHHDPPPGVLRRSPEQLLDRVRAALTDAGRIASETL